MLRLLRALPYYATRRSLLDKGLRIPGEVGPCSFTSPVTLLTSEARLPALTRVCDPSSP